MGNKSSQLDTLERQMISSSIQQQSVVFEDEDGFLIFSWRQQDSSMNAPWALIEMQRQNAKNAKIEAENAELTKRIEALKK